MFVNQFTVDPHFRLAHDGLEMQEEFFAFQFIGRGEVFAIPRFALIIGTSAGFGRQILHAVGQRDDGPLTVVEMMLPSFGLCSFAEAPSRIHGVNFAAGIS